MFLPMHVVACELVWSTGEGILEAVHIVIGPVSQATS